MEQVSLNKELYDLESINEAITDFSNIAKITVSETKLYYKLRLVSGKDEKRTILELCNYLLSIIINKSSNIIKE